jgi:hypothetical protein
MGSVGPYFERVSEVARANAEKNEALMRTYRNRKLPAKFKDRKSAVLRGSPALPSRALPNFNAMHMMRTPPFDSQATQPPATPNGSFAFANANVDGALNFFLDTPITAPAPSNFMAGALVGILFFPTIDTVLSPFFGFASLQLSASIFMDSNLSCNFLGNAHSEGSVGWIIQEFDAQGNFTQLIQEIWTEQYYLDVNFGQTNSALVNNAAFGSATTFVTNPVHFYQIWVWFWGQINAAGNQGLWASQAAGFGQMSLESITVDWNPVIFL